MRRFLDWPAIVGALLMAWSASAPAQDAIKDWPTRTVRIVIPLGAGGGGDIFARLLAEELQKKFGQSFIVENRPGGGLNIGGRACAESAPDGHTLCVMSSEPVVYNQFLFKSLPFNPEKDFEPVTNLFINSVALVANSKLGIKTIPEMIALAKAQPGTLSYGTFSFVLVQYMEKLKKREDIDIVRVPFRSGNEIVNAIMSGTAPIAFLGLANMLPQIRSGHITGIALNSYSRSPLFPDIPTLKEASGEDVPPTWFGLFVPAGTPRPIIQKLHAEVVRITGDPGWRQRNFIDRAIEYAVGPTEEFARFVVESRKKAGEIAREAGIQPQ